MVEKGGPRDPVARNIRNQQNRDAMPSKEEIERKARKEEQIHAQWKAVEALFDRIDGRASDDAVGLVADILGFDELADRANRYGGLSTTGGPDFRARHEESWQKPDDWPPDHPQARPVQPFDEQKQVDMERVQRLKQEAFLRIQQVDPADFAVVQKRMAPFGNKPAVAVLYDGDVYTNGTWEKAMDDDQWRDRFSDRKIDEYQMELSEMLAEERGNGDA